MGPRYEGVHRGGASTRPQAVDVRAAPAVEIELIRHPPRRARRVLPGSMGTQDALYLAADAAREPSQPQLWSGTKEES